MANFRKKHKGHRGCGFCKPHKSQGNSVKALKHRYRMIKSTKIIYDAD